MEISEKFIKDFKPFGAAVTHQGKKVRPETKTNVAIGRIATVENSGKNNLKVVMKVAGAKYDFSGFVNDNTPVAKLIKQAKEEDLVICARFEKKRKKNVDPNLPIDEITKDSFIAKENIVNIVAGVYNFNSKEWILSSDAVSNPAEDPEYVKNELASATYSTDDFFTASAPKIQTTDADWKANHLISMFTYAREHCKENGVDIGIKGLKVLATHLLTAADVLQMKANKFDMPNYNDYSHTKARGMLFSWMKANPLSTDLMKTKGAFNKWVEDFAEENVELWAWAKEEAQK